MPDLADDSKQGSNRKSFLEKLSSVFFHEAPDSREELLEKLHEAHGRNLFDEDALAMIEGVLQVSELRASDLMVPRSQMKVIDISEDPKTWIPQVIKAGHSRFPVIDGDRDNILGILLAKDLLRIFEDPQYKIQDHLRVPVFIPESKPVDVLLKEFRMKRNHLALVVDEFGSVSGLITIEDVLEEIVGDIDDEYDEVEDANIVEISPGKWRVKAHTEIDEFNEIFGTSFHDERYETVGGLVSDELEHVPHVGEELEIGGFRFTVLRADARQVELFQLEKLD